MDVSDGLVGDFGKLCSVSGVAADIQVTRVPLSDAARKAVASEPVLIEAALTGGDDYEIVATVPSAAVDSLMADAATVGVAMAEIGEIRDGRNMVRFLDRSGQPLAFGTTSFSHF
jgi:thiamine-monophosphate kinase